MAEPERPTAEVWEIPRKVWFILLSWGLAVLVLAGLFSVWTWRVQEHAAAERESLRLEQDRAMCTMIDNVFLTGPEPVEGAAGERSRVVRRALTDYRKTLRCDRIGD